MRRMLIDAAHPEETRVAAVNGIRLEEFDIETSTKRQLKGNIYLAKIIRVEPSLQAAFVDYGGNRHGFLAFSEIHPDYFQIPAADREALLAEQRAESMRESSEQDSESDDDEPAESRPRSLRTLRHYKIQDVIKRRQIILVQVVKEERGNKGAALTTYLSLAGRYCVLMPNTARGGGGVSRKITSVSDRRRLKNIVADLEIPDGLAVIVRTAGSERTKAEIKRDYEYLLRLWDNIRTLTLKSVAPYPVYEEANLIKRAIRDLYAKDIEEILVEGDEGYRVAKDFMRMLTPSHAKKVQPYKDPLVPLFHRYQVESQLDGIHNPVVQLRSGGYIVINPTEALVSIDVNSGRATKERHIEETALKTNLEAADEIARQLRLRDLAGLIVIDFIDMEDPRNNAAVERRFKEATKTDRARIQLGHISIFGLLELSRQRLHPSLQETSFHPCPHCNGSGYIRSVESSAIYILRIIEEEGILGTSSGITLTVSTPIALYILNQKRQLLNEAEARYRFRVTLIGDDSLIQPDFRIERTRGNPSDLPVPPHFQAIPQMDESVTKEDEGVSEETAPLPDNDDHAEHDDSSRSRRGRRKKRGKNGDSHDSADLDLTPAAADDQKESDDADEAQPAAAQTSDSSENRSEQENRKSRRRGKRGGRRRNRRHEEDSNAPAQNSDEETALLMAPEQLTPLAAPETLLPLPAPESVPLLAAAEEKTEDLTEGVRIPDEKPSMETPESAPQEESGTPTKQKRPRKKAPPKPKTRKTPSAAISEESAPQQQDAQKTEETFQDSIPMAEMIAETVTLNQEDITPSASKPQRRGWWNRSSQM